MNIQTFYPVFENGQVLTSGHLNDIVDYLEPQDRLTRTRLSGIGIVCGLEPDWDAVARTLTLSRGVAVTSEGFLIAEDAVALDRVRPYSVPIPSGPAATPEDKAKARYPFLFDGNAQREAFELLPTDFQPAPGEAAPTPLSDGLVADRAVMLFLERNLEALKNCDVNDCSDKGSEMKVTLRRLLVRRVVADKILAEEAAIAGRPVDRANHPRLGLAPLSIDKINPSGLQIANLSELYDRILAAAGRAGQQLLPAMGNAWAAYRSVLEDMFPAGRFPEGPFPKHHFLNMAAAFAETPTLAQYLHGGMHDLVRSYSEFIEHAARFDAECCPHPGRFPRHVLAGDVLARPVAFEKAPRTLADYAGYDPLTATDGPAPEGIPAARRHHFIPSPALDAGSDKAAELRAIFSRMVLLAQTYATRGLLGVDIHLTPSRDGAAPLGERAIPFFYGFKTTGDLFRNWSWRKARANLLGSVFSYQLTAAAKDHPLLLRQDDQDFIRIEGVVGKPLGAAMARLVQQKRALGVSFAVEPVWIGYGHDDGQDQEAKNLAFQAIAPLLRCRTGQLDAVFRTIMAALFAFMVWLVRLLGRLDATKATIKPQVAGTVPVADPTRLAGLQPVGFLRLDPEEEVRVRGTADRLLSDLRTATAIRADLVRNLAVEGAGDKPLEKVAVANIYDTVRDASIGGEIFDRVRAAAGDLGVQGSRDEIAATVYPAVALMARAEEMMKATSAASIAEFDEARFGTAFRGFADAYETYAARAEIDPARTTQEIAAANAAIVANRGFVAGAASQFSGAAMTAELGKALQSMFVDLTMPRYAQRHPGLEHKGGVPVGGTFVLLYGSRRHLEQGLNQALADLGAAFRKHFEKLTGGEFPGIAIDNAIRDILASSRPRSDDLLDELVVLGDFCLPSLCCDAECLDDEIERRIVRKEGAVRPDSGGGRVPPAREPTRPTPTPTPEPSPSEPVRGSNGTVEIAVFQRQRTGREVALSGALIVMTDLATDRSREVQLDSATHTLQLKAGKYAFVAVARDRRSESVEVALRAGATEQVRLVIVVA